MLKVFKAGPFLTSYVSNPSIMAPKLPIEIILTICKDAAQPTFSQREKYDIKNPYSTALSLCLVSRLVRRIILPDFLHTILLRRRHSLKKFANALLMQKAYAEKKSDLFFDYTSAVQRMWISDAFDYFVYAEARSEYEEARSEDEEAQSEDEEAQSEDEEARSEDEDPHLRWGIRNFLSKNDERARNISVSLPVILAAPELAVDYGHLKHIIWRVQDAWSSRTDLNVGGHSSFPGKTKNLTIIRQGHHEHFLHNTVETFVFLASIPHLTHLIDLAEHSLMFRGISCGTESPKFPVYLWMRDHTWNSMESLETFSVVYPHLPPIHDFKSITYAAYATRGIDLHVERFTVSAALYKQDPEVLPVGATVVSCDGSFHSIFGLGIKLGPVG
ncbi:uncharacterized protein F5891DRAFT_1177372 [Suillus fuscotomentosus]|uniref:Uncharacterized protein n=1 Tax=Suillus fuscotomentosus TaxID=1912939 RepID=A0AAD4HCI6_9AGAM|nr:uncharacterized protein F5891DRAFT_1177372 [Suillus fuscotomentosus]KAG1888434.1 hypothetical protein F5891DRAFT_1177372 [Suillus fuscotomentosus]